MNNPYLTFYTCTDEDCERWGRGYPLVCPRCGRWRPMIGWPSFVGRWDRKGFWIFKFTTIKRAVTPDGFVVRNANDARRASLPYNPATTNRLEAIDE